METRTEDGGLTRRPTLASSWDATGRVLTHNLLLTRVRLRARDFSWGELQAPPAPGCAGPKGTWSLRWRLPRSSGSCEGRRESLSPGPGRAVDAGSLPGRGGCEVGRGPGA
ncbi:ATPase PAAT [Callithrix jacchus]|uniref:ATPase PAAT-like n=1 Tax=Callithrix jacchus TaxID=9483 RepID=UPI00159E1CC5|nr:ATPase PAAT-like [Callithrix jacchus]